MLIILKPRLCSTVFVTWSILALSFTDSNILCVLSFSIVQHDPDLIISICWSLTLVISVPHSPNDWVFTVMYACLFELNTEAFNVVDNWQFYFHGFKVYDFIILRKWEILNHLFWLCYGNKYNQKQQIPRTQINISRLCTFSNENYMLIVLNYV